MAAIRFYLHFGIWECESRWEPTALGTTNYVTLLDQLRRSRREKNEPVLLVTFNYDRMIEGALSSVKISISELSHYIQHDTFKLFKLHGSVHWAREVESAVTNIGGLNVHEVAAELIDTAPNLKITDRFRLVNRKDRRYSAVSCYRHTSRDEARLRVSERSSRLPSYTPWEDH
jgi:hypothetical protein